MNPISYTSPEPLHYVFNYDPVELENWHKEGKEYGSVGAILTEINGSLMVYHCYGTLEHSNANMYIMKLQHNEAFDGPIQRPEWYLKPEAEERARLFWEDMAKNMRMIFLDELKTKRQ